MICAVASPPTWETWASSRMSSKRCSTTSVSMSTIRASSKVQSGKHSRLGASISWRTSKAAHQLITSYQSEPEQADFWEGPEQADFWEGPEQADFWEGPEQADFWEGPEQADFWEGVGKVHSHIPAPHAATYELGILSKTALFGTSLHLAPHSYRFMLNLVHSLYREGNSFALVLRNERFEVASLHLMNPQQSSPFVVRNEDDGDAEIFYRLGGNAVVDGMFAARQLTVPQRDVLHIKLRSNHRHPHPLVGETPLAAALMDVSFDNALVRQQIQ